ncbi:MAG: hypothetical protein JWO82_1097 [Akkermansiaceae bacterium]|nr:hypothetical protein [Akkermansiaceae bacterium]
MRVDEKREAEGERLRRNLEDVRACFGHEAGRRVLGLLHAAAATNSPCFLPGKGGVFDTHAAAFRDGRRSVILDIERWVRELGEGPEEKGPVGRR